ncbi:hypothetical protein AMS68_003319 [Peltaster fructicola]|uniref:Cytochrome P450 n=1 Tax=Peltaster fructicola TaxID=286661 RepID=A0A6H0XSQ5_9PEZI|nr:hypothetical protein AMS68_003319 [Peltaster fructicola]
MAFIDFFEDHPLVAFCLIGLVLFICISGGIASTAKPIEGLPWVGVQDGTPFALTRAAFSSVISGKSWLNAAYQKYSQQGKTYIFPDISGRHEIVIPNNKLRWLTDKPDNVASVGRAHYDVLQGDYAFTDPILLQTLFHERVIHKNLPRKLDAIIPDVWDEIKDCVDQTWGHDKVNFKDVPVWDNVMYIISRLSNRLFVGKPLCRNETFLRNNGAFAMDVITLVALMPFVPKLLHPIFGRLLSIPNHYHAWQIRRIVMPHIKQRLADIDELERDPSSKRTIPEDYITWHIRTAKADGQAYQLNPDMIAKSILPIEFAAIHTTALTVTMTLFDLFSSPPSKKYIEGIREEAERLWKECNGQWDKPTLSKMLRADSAIRESMRVSNFLSRGVSRKILVPGGVKNEEEGWTAPEGSFVCVDADSRHHDAELFPNPDTYDAFRFSRPREEYEATHADRSNSEEYLKMKNLSLISTGENFLVFGHGRHACPGRFFVQHEIKMLLAYIVMNYEVPLLAERPPNQWLGTSVIPPSKAKLKVQRREAA